MGHEVPSGGYLESVAPPFLNGSKSVESKRDTDGDVNTVMEMGRLEPYLKVLGGTITVWASTKSLNTVPLTYFMSGTVLYSAHTLI